VLLGMGLLRHDARLLRSRLPTWVRNVHRSASDSVPRRQLRTGKRRELHMYRICLWQMLLAVGMVVSSNPCPCGRRMGSDLFGISGSSVEYCGKGCQSPYGVCTV